MIARYGTFEYALAERYRFEEELGRGAMGTVYRAQDVRLGRPVAIKMLHPMLTNELGVARFQSEIRIAASLHHPNIIGVHESGEVDGRLFFVMDYLGGETLRARLNREKQLGIEESLSIVDEVAKGLQYAHDHGVVHRDVKPENIILSEGRACLLDFGLARALGDVDADRLTASGLSVGTPQYLSPEQASAEKEVGPKADQYALACVLYEMLVGEPPFTGRTASSIAMRHISESPIPLRVRRKTTPASIEQAVMRAMEKVPADRFQSLHDFSAACRDAREGAIPQAMPAKQQRPPVRPMLAAAFAFAVAATAFVVARSESSASDTLDDGLRFISGRSLDTSRFVVMPLSGDTSALVRDWSARLGTALSEWKDVSVAETGAIKQESSGAGTVARSLNAGRYITGSASPDGDSLHLRIEVRDTRRPAWSRKEMVTVARAPANANEVYAHIAYVSLFEGDVARRNEAAARGTRSREALMAYLDARQAMRTWNLTRADSALDKALAADAGFAQASLARANLRIWRSDDAPPFSASTSALANDARLTPGDRLQATALMDLQEGRFPAACGSYEALIRTDSLDFASWYGLAECHRRDSIVVTLPGGQLAFRSSRGRDATAIRRAFELLDGIDPCCTARAVKIARAHIKYTVATRARVGFQAPSQRFGAYPELNADTLAFYPRPLQAMVKVPPATKQAAIARQRVRLFELARRLLALSPNSADALELLGEALELRGYAASIDTVRRARLLATTSAQRNSFAVYEAWLRIKFALPGSTAKLQGVRAFADTILQYQEVTPSTAGGIASLAALVGDAHRAAALSRISAEAIDPNDSAELLATASSYLVYAAMGGPVDSLPVLESRLETAVANTLPPERQLQFRQSWSMRAARMAFPVYRPADTARLDPAQPLGKLQAAYLAGRIRDVRAGLDAATKARANIPAAEFTIDALYPEVWLRAAIGDASGAIRMLTVALEATQYVPARQFSEPGTAGALMRAMSLLATLEAAHGERTKAQQWARAVAALTDTSKAIARSSRAPVLALAR
ncbi:MAG: serine/threonine-protein kinase [Gemmatimonadaceae bacterium]